MIQSVSETTYLVTSFNICSRQESRNVLDWAKDGFLRTFLHRRAEKMVVCRMDSNGHCIWKTSSTFNSTEIPLRLISLRTKSNPQSLDTVRPFKQTARKKLDCQGPCRTIFHEDLLHLLGIQADPKTATSASCQELDTESYVKAYCLTAQLRPGVIHVKFWQYSNASVTVVKDDNGNSEINKDDADINTEAIESRENDTVNADDQTSVTIPDPELLKQVIRLREYLASKSLESPTVSLNQVDCSHPKPKRKLKKTLLKALHKLTELPRRFLKLREVKIAPNSVTIIAYPGRRKGPKSGQRSRQRSQNQITPNESSEVLRIPVQVTQLDDEDQRPRRDNMVTSVETIFTRQAPPVTTNLMSSIESEQRLAARRQGQRQLQDVAGATSRRPTKYPEFTDQTKRQLSFMTWPASTMQDSANMASQGFFYTGMDKLLYYFPFNPLSNNPML